MSDEFGIDVSHGVDGEICLLVRGEVDVATCEQLRDAIVAASDQEGVTMVVVDAGGVSFMDSRGVAALVMAHRTLRERDGVALRVVRPGPQVASLMEMTGLDKLLEPGAAP